MGLAAFSFVQTWIKDSGLKIVFPEICDTTGPNGSLRWMPTKYKSVATNWNPQITAIDRTLTFQP